MFEKRQLLQIINQQFNKAIKDYIETANKKLDELILQLSKHTFQLGGAIANPHLLRVVWPSNKASSDLANLVIIAIAVSSCFESGAVRF